MANKGTPIGGINGSTYFLKNGDILDAYGHLIDSRMLILALFDRVAELQSRVVLPFTAENGDCKPVETWGD